MREVQYIMWFSKLSERLSGEEKIENFNLVHFKKIFNHKEKDDPYMYSGVYRLSVEHVEQVQGYLKHTINLNKYIYQFGIYGIEDD